MAGGPSVRRFAMGDLEEFPELGRYGDSDFVPRGFVLEGTDLFDSGFFGYSPAEAERLDPQQRLFLEVCWHALEDAGISPEKTRATIGVYGAANHSYYCAERIPSIPISAFEAYVESTYASDKDYMTSRVAYKLNRRGVRTDPARLPGVVLGGPGALGSRGRGHHGGRRRVSRPLRPVATPALVPAQAQHRMGSLA